MWHDNCIAFVVGQTPLTAHDQGHEDKTATSSAKDKILRTFRVLIYIDIFKLCYV